MNEVLFFLHVLAVLGFVLGALRFGKGALIGLIALQGVLANLFVVKQITLFGWNVTSSDVFAIGAILSLNLLQEYFGKESAREASRISLFSLLFFAAMSQIHLLYVPASFDTAHAAFSSIFSHSLRIVFASIGTFYAVQQFDLRFFPLLKGALPIRIFISLFCSQWLDTVLFSFLGLYGLVESLFDVIVLSLAIKTVIIGVNSPFLIFAKRFVKNEFPV